MSYFPELDRGGYTITKKTQQNKKGFFSIRTETPTLSDNIEHYVSYMINPYKITKIGYRLTQ